MSPVRVIRLAFSIRILVTAALIGLMFSTGSMAWQAVAYAPYPSYPSAAYYYPYSQPGYYPGHSNNYQYPAQPNYAPVKPAATPTAKIKSVTEKTRQKIKDVSEDISAKKKAFMDKLLPYIERENARLKQIRQQVGQLILKLEARVKISQKSKDWLKKLAKKYRIKGDPVEDNEARKELLQKVDIIPASLTLAQAANESAWGKSRFATEANNLFGIWTFDKNKGLKPQNRDVEKKHLVRKFENVGDSVKHYMHILNSHPAYKKLREIRQQFRHKQLTPDGHALAVGLEKYSAKGAQYIQLIRDLIRQNQWANLDSLNQSA